MKDENNEEEVPLNEPEPLKNGEKIDYDPTKVNLDAEQLKSLPRTLLEFFLKTISIKDEVDRKGTVQGIKDGIEFYGSNVWILICSIVVASIGLNNNDTAVIVGAMLISPLMGPIRGLGLSIATNDFQTLIKSLINFAIMVGASLAASYIYFFFTPLKAETSELLGRTKPHVLVVLVAFFGGLAGVIAASTKHKSAAATVVPGVAIATALMPPMCTAGYALAIHNWNYFFGAIYLFLLNSFFIALSTIIVLRLLKFPVVSFVNPKTERKVKIYTFVVALLIIIPSVFKFVSVIRESIFEQNANEYLTELEHINRNRNIKLDPTLTYYKDTSEISIWVSGDYIDKEQQELWKELRHRYNLNDVNIIIKQSTKQQKVDTANIQLQLFDKFYENQLSEKATIAEERDFYRNELIKLQSSEVNLYALEKRIKSSFPEIDRFTYSKAFESTFSDKIDTVYVVNVHWKDRVDSLTIAQKTPRFTEAIRTEIELATKTSINNLKVLNY